MGHMESVVQDMFLAMESFLDILHPSQNFPMSPGIFQPAPRFHLGLTRRMSSMPELFRDPRA